MPTPIVIIIGELQLEAELTNHPVAQAIAAKLPIRFSGDYWGEELYGTIPVRMDEPDTVDLIDEPGTIAYWPVGKAFCIFWGPTPVSDGEEIRPASPVNIIGRVTRGLDKLINEKPDPINIKLEPVDE